MYEFIKHIIRSIIPKKVLFANEEKFRRATSFLYNGANVTCTTCNKNLRKIIVLKNGEKLCPLCGSLGRHRRLFSLLKGHITGKILLDFSPSRALYRAFKNTQGIEYIATDYSNEFLSDKKLDITSIKEPDESFDLVLCYHVLEHIENDRQAIEELYRILKIGGECWIQTPFKEGQVYENPDITDPKQRLIHFGQADHVRIYSVNGLKERLEAAGFYVTVNEYKAEPKYGFDDEIILIAKK